MRERPRAGSISGSGSGSGSESESGIISDRNEAMVQ